MSPERGRAEGGFTLIELLIVIAIEALIVGALGSAFVLVMNNSTSVKENLDRTSDARFAASYIVSDARNSSGPDTSLSDTTSCPDANPPVAGTPTAVVRFDWLSTTSTGATTANIVNYVLVSNSLLRRQCQNGTLVHDTALASNISSATAACSPNADCSGTPTTITATITETQGTASGAAYQYTLTGAFRKALDVGAPLTPSGPSSPYPLISLGQACSGGTTAMKVSGSASVHVQGDAYLNSANSGACEALALTGSASFKADNTKILTGGTCSNAGTSVCPTYSNFSPALSDPFASLTAPSTSGLPAQSGCAGGTAQPGVYASTLTLSGSATCNLASGVYIFQNGLSTANTAVLTNDAAGVLIYITGGQFSLGGNSSVNLSAMTSGSYAGIAVWQAAADTTSLTIGNGISPVITGALYAPAATFAVSGSSQPYVTTVVAQCITVGSSSILTIGAPLVITNASLPAWTVNTPYPSTPAATLTGTGGHGTYTWSATGLPTGLSINASTGVISGTPTVVSAPSVTITLNDSFGDVAASTIYTLTINTTPSIATASPLPTWAQNIAGYSTTVAASGGTAPFNWSASGLPAGLTMNASTGVISGTPTGTGTSSASITLTDGAGLTANASLSITISTGPIITSIVMSNKGATPGKMEQGDTIVITYSGTMRVSSFCSTWSNDNNNQTLNANNDVSVAISNGTGAVNDALTVTSTTCTFNFGSIDLGSPGYVSSVVSFGGSGANVSTITWNAAAHTMTITLGAKKSGTAAAVASSSPVYTASPSQVGSGGVAVVNSPFTVSNGVQF